MKWAEEDLNLHGFPQRLLRPSRLPVSPSAQSQHTSPAGRACPGPPLLIAGAGPANLQEPPEENQTHSQFLERPMTALECSLLWPLRRILLQLGLHSGARLPSPPHRSTEGRSTTFCGGEAFAVQENMGREGFGPSVQLRSLRWPPAAPAVGWSSLFGRTNVDTSHGSLREPSPFQNVGREGFEPSTLGLRVPCSAN